jgi:predicted NAD/FAD-binding protein
MHIVIIGGGAAGMVTAHYLARTHKVTILEKANVLGGNIRTLNKNVKPANIPANVFLDNGVIEFHRDHSPGLQELVAELGLRLLPVNGGSTAIYLENGQRVFMPGAIRGQSVSILTRAGMFAQLAWTLRHLFPIGLKMYRCQRRNDASVNSFLGDDLLSSWLRMLLMYGYSIPYEQVDNFPARMAIATLRRGFIGTEWVRMEGGVYSYIDKIVERAGTNLTIELEQSSIEIKRNPAGVTVECNAGQLKADWLVFAQPPDQVLKLLADPDADEQRLFSNWQANYATTIIHTDTSVYDAWGAAHYTEFDLFLKNDGKDAAYNAYLNRLAGLPDDYGTHYFLAYNLEDRIHPEKILHRQQHHTPLYTANAAKNTSQIKANNGCNRTYHAGAYLHDGLHEGAIQSAMAIRRAFGY